MIELEMNPNVRKRLEFIEFSLFWEGQIGRKQIKDQFEISLQQATIDLNAYLELAPSNMLYNPRVKRYVPQENFEPVLIKGSSAEYFRFFDAYVQNYRTAEEVWMSSIPDYKSVSKPKRHISATILRSVLKAIRENQSFEMTYVSLHSNAGKVAPRKVSPHALATDGNRWHMRAYDHSHERFADFVLSRIEKAAGFEDTDIKPEQDIVWDTQRVLCFIPHADLEPKKQAKIADEYEMDNGVLRLEVSQAMLFYYLRQFGFNPDPVDGGPMRNESSYQLQLQNINQVEGWLQRR